MERPKDYMLRFKAVTSKTDSKGNLRKVVYLTTEQAQGLYAELGNILGTENGSTRGINLDIHFTRPSFTDEATGITREFDSGYAFVKATLPPPGQVASAGGTPKTYRAATTPTDIREKAAKVKAQVAKG